MRKIAFFQFPALLVAGTSLDSGRTQQRRFSADRLLGSSGGKNRESRRGRGDG